MAKDWLNDLYSDDKQAAKPVQHPNIIQSVLSGAKGLGLGAAQDILAPAYLAGQEVLHGQNPTVIGGGQANAQQLNQYAQSNPFATKEQLQQMGGAKQVGQDVAGAASWMVPEAKVAQVANPLLKLLSGVATKGVQGGIQGGLYAASQGQDAGGGATTGAIVNPLLHGAGNVLTDTLPRYIGLRNFGPAGLQLPEVTKAENAAGGQTLKNVRGGILSNIKPFELNPIEAGGQTDRQAVLSKIDSLSKSPEWKGTNGLSELVKRSGKGFASPEGAGPDLKSLVQNSTDLFDAYSQMKNYAQSLGAYGNKQSDKLTSFLKSAAGIVREHLINTSDNPTETKKAMDLYANQTAMNKSSTKGGNLVSNMLGEASKLGPSADFGLAGLAAISGFHGLAGYPLMDYALTNPVTGPKLARSLVTGGQKAANSGAADVLRKLGVIGAQGAINASQ